MTRTDEMSPDLLTLAQAAVLLGVSERTAERLARRGDFPGDAAVKVGSRWRVARPLLDRWMGKAAS